MAADFAQQAGVDVTIIGLDWSVAALDQARGDGLEVVRGSVEHPGLPLRHRSVDVVIISELIEHLVDTDTVLSEARRVLRPGGSLLLSTPNLAAWYNRGLLMFGVQPMFTEVSLQGIYGRPGHEVVGHLRVFTRRALEAPARGPRLRGRHHHRGALPRRPPALAAPRPSPVPDAEPVLDPAGLGPRPLSTVRPAATGDVALSLTVSETRRRSAGRAREFVRCDDENPPWPLRRVAGVGA